MNVFILMRKIQGNGAAMIKGGTNHLGQLKIKFRGENQMP